MTSCVEDKDGRRVVAGSGEEKICEKAKGEPANGDASDGVEYDPI